MMATTDQAFIRAYCREPGTEVPPAESADSQTGRAPTAGGVGVLRPEAPIRQSAQPAWFTTIEVGAGTSVQLVGADAVRSEPVDRPHDVPPEPIYPSAIRQRQYWRHDQPAVDATETTVVSAPVPHYDPGPRDHHTREHITAIGQTESGAASEASTRFSRESPPNDAAANWQPRAAAGETGTGFSSPLEPKSTVAEFRKPTICGRLLQQCAAEYHGVVTTIASTLEDGRSLIGVAGCYPQVGCTTTLLCLALRLAAEGRSVALADANFVRPELAKFLGFHPATSWLDVLTRGVPVGEALYHSAADGLTVLPTTPIAAGENVARSGLQWAVTAGALRYAYDVTLLDLGAILDPSRGNSSWQVVQAMRVDGVLLVADGLRESGADRQRAVQRLADAHCPILGVIENFA